MSTTAVDPVRTLGAMTDLHALSHALTYLRARISLALARFSWRDVGHFLAPFLTIFVGNLMTASMAAGTGFTWAILAGAASVTFRQVFPHFLNDSQREALLHDLLDMINQAAEAVPEDHAIAVDIHPGGPVVSVTPLPALNDAPVGPVITTEPHDASPHVNTAVPTQP